MTDAFTSEIRFALAHAASSETISTLVDQALLRSSDYSRTQLLLLIVDVCLETGRPKQARRWLGTVGANVAQEDLKLALNSALATEHVQLALDLGRRLVTQQPEGNTQDRLQLASDAVMLAKKLRLPYGRNGVWQSHLKLLELAAGLLDDSLLSHSDQTLCQAAQQLVEQIEEMKNCRPRPVLV